MATPRSVIALAAAGAVLAPAAVLTTPALAKVPTRHVICDKAAKWIPTDYTGGCYLTFSTAVRTIAYNAFAASASSGTQWIGSDGDATPLTNSTIIKSMKCRRGGNFNGVKANRFHAGWCTWTDTFGHFQEGEHPVHTWGCEVTVVLRSGPGGKSRMRAGRPELQWTVTAAPHQDVIIVGGEYPYCGKDAPDDTWQQG